MAILTFKELIKKLSLALNALQSMLNLPAIRYRMQDESWVGRKTGTARVITTKGVKPTLIVMFAFQGWEGSLTP